MKKILACAALFTLSFSASFVLAGNLTVQEQMGRHLYMDKDLSFDSTQSCATCHHRSSGFADPTNSRDPENVMVSLGDDSVSLGGRNAPSAAYAGYSPILSQDANGEWIGGMFWDGRMTGEVLGDPLAEQALGPPLNPLEMNMPDAASVVARVAESPYAHLFIENYGPTFFDDPAAAFDEIARLIAAYERSSDLSPFNSRYDRGELTAAELRGLDAFKMAQCDTCHSLTPPAGAAGPVFTTYGMVRFHIDRGGLIPEVDTNLIDPIPVALSEQEIVDIVAFLGVLSDNGMARNGR